MNQQVERVFVAVDVNNLWHSCQQIYGRDYRVSYPDLKDLIMSLEYDKVPREVTLTAYVIEIPSRDGKAKGARNERFIEYLRGLGFKIKKRRMQFDKSTGKPYATDWDVGIALDAMTLKSTYDTFTLVSGDGDYAILIGKLKWLGKRAEVITFEQTTSRLLHEEANNVIFLKESHVFREPNLQRDRNDDPKKDSAP
jgi:uncharacterized LabA/DUF88 family protein